MATAHKRGDRLRGRAAILEGRSFFVGTEQAARHRFKHTCDGTLDKAQCSGYYAFVRVQYWGCSLAGLQAFVYDVPDQDAAKRLRARSSALTLVPALIGHKLRQADPQTDFIYLGGGKLLSSTLGATEELEQTLREWSRELAQFSGGLLGLYWASAETPTDLLARLSEAKWQAGRSPNGEWFGHLGAPALVPKRPGLGDPEWEAEVGGELARNLNAMGFTLGSGWRIIGDLRARLAEGEAHIGIGTGPLAITLPRYVPMDGSDVRPLDKIAAHGFQSGKGYPYLAVLKLDGDAVGSRFAAAMAEGIEEYRKLSTSLKQFFGIRLPEFLQKDMDNVYLVYSGGDDLVAVGHFRDILDAAIEIQKLYPEGTVSAGVSFFRQKSPMLPAVEQADRFLEQSKNRGRNRITVGGQTLGWESLYEAISLSDALAEAAKADLIPSSVLQLVRELGEWFLEPASNIERNKALPLVWYFLNRRKVNLSEVDPTIQRFFASLCDSEAAWEHAALIATLSLWKLRESKT